MMRFFINKLLINILVSFFKFHFPLTFFVSLYRRNSEMTAGGFGEGGEMVQVQIIPQDDNWGDNQTAITGNTSVRSESLQVGATKFILNLFDK